MEENTSKRMLLIMEKNLKSAYNGILPLEREFILDIQIIDEMTLLDNFLEYL